MTTGITCAAGTRCPHPAPAETGICAQHRRQAQLAQLRQSPSAAVRAAAWLLTQLHHPQPQAAPGREAEPG
jgi:hypothetical protein